MNKEREQTLEIETPARSSERWNPSTSVTGRLTFQVLIELDRHEDDEETDGYRIVGLVLVPTSKLCFEYSDHLPLSRGDHQPLLPAIFLSLYDHLRRIDAASLEQIERSVLSRGSSEGAPDWLKNAKSILSEQFAEQCTLRDIAATVGVHPVHLAREFRKYFGASVGEYVRKVRIEYACQQLISSDDPPAKIASAAGFSDQSHFSRTFKRLRGTTPGRYRASVKPRNSSRTVLQYRHAGLSS